MWKDYSASYIRKNRASSVSVMVAAFIAALFLSLLCCLAYNFWAYEVEQIMMEEGDWQGRITGAIDGDDLLVIQNFANVERVVVNEGLSDGQEMAADIYFQNIRSIYRDMPLIMDRIGSGNREASYHEVLLSRYLVHDPQDEEPPLLMAFYLAVLCMVSFSLILIIHNSFAVSMNARIHQFGIFSSIGATPGQIRTCLIQEAAALCSLPVLLGSVIGIALSYGVIQAVNLWAEEVSGRHEAVFQYRFFIFVLTLAVSVVTVLVSAWMPARKLSRLTPLQAIRGSDGLQLKKKGRFCVWSFLFGIEGELAGNTLKAQRRALRTSTLSLTFSFLGFTLMLCFLTLAGISTDHTYFERYQDVWDVMAAVKDTHIEDFEQTEAIRKLRGARSSVMYQKAAAEAVVPETDVSEELSAIGGLGAVAGSSVNAEEGCYLVQAPVIIMDDAGFMEYCEQIGIAPVLDGTVILNRIWDSVNSNFRYREYVPFVKEEQEMITLQNAVQTENSVKIPIAAYTQEAPVLREEYDDNALVQFIPLSLWREISGQFGKAESDLYIRILGKEGIGLEEAAMLEEELLQCISPSDAVESENRIQEKIANDRMMNGFMLVTGAFCALLAVIGIANVFSNTLGFLRQRKREFAQYMSVGMTLESMRKMFWIEAFVIAGRPIFITLPLTALSVGFMISASYLNPMEFLVKAPIVPVIVFILAIWGFVAAAYAIGGKKVLRCSLTDALRNDGVEY